MHESDVQRGGDSFSDEVTSRFGLLPNFFCTASTAEGLIQQLWQFAKAGYLDCPLPSLFKERLFVHLSRFCEVRYCIVRHVGFLIGEGRPAGDASAVPQSIDQVLALLRRPLPNAVQLALSLERLEHHTQEVEVPTSDTQLERHLFDALTVMFVEPRCSERARHAVAHAFGEGHFEILTAFLAFVRTAHYWTETHPELEIESDMRAVMARHDELARLLLDRTEAEQMESSEAHRRTLAELRESRGERMKVEEALQITEKRLKQALQAARMAFWEWDTVTDTVIGSDTLDMLFGLFPGEKIQTSARGLDLIHPDDAPALRAKVTAAVLEGGAWHHQFRIIRPCDGKMVWLEEHAHATKGSVVGQSTMAGLVWDITERKLLEASLQEADHRKDVFLATLSHELRGPLAPLRNGLQIARLTINADAPVQRTIEMMDRQVTQIAHLVDDLLDVSRITSGKIELRLGKISMRDVLTRSAESVRTAIDKHGHQLTIECGAEELWIKGDFDRLSQIFSNLLTNAAKYTEPGGKIELKAMQDGDWAIIMVGDNGIGIPEPDLPRIFEIFSQLPMHRGRADGGLGIGLSLVRKFVELHHGTVSAFSEGSGKGSTFVVRLPLMSECVRQELESC